MERKVGSGRKGTVDEEEYLLKSVTKLVSRWTATQRKISGPSGCTRPDHFCDLLGEGKKLLPHLLRLSEQHRSGGRALQQDMESFEKELTDAIDEMWTRPATSDKQTLLDSWASRMLEKEKEGRIDPLDRVPKPDIETSDWGIKLLRAHD